MTDETRPTPPTDPAEDRLRAALDAAATAADPVADDWPDVLARADGSHLGAVDTAPPGRSHRRSTRRVATFAVAAALTLLAGTALILAATTDEDADTITAGPSRADEPTGWYVPSPLPTGWSVSNVGIASTPWNCPCRSVTWADEPTGRSLRYSRNPVVEPPAGSGVPPGREVDLGGVTGRFDDEDGPLPTISWTEAGDRRVLIATGIEADDLLASARALVGRPDPLDSPIDGLTVVPGSEVDTDHRVERAVVVTLRTAAGHPISYALTPRAGASTSWFGRFLTPLTPIDLDTEIDPVHELSGWPATPDAAPPIAAPSGTFTLLPRYLARPPGAEILLPSLASPDAATGVETYDPTTVVADTDQLVRSLRSASADEWAAFLASADEHDPTLDGVDRLADLGGRDATATSTTSTTSPATPSTTTTPPSPTTVLSPGPDLPYDFEHVTFDVRWGEGPRDVLEPGEPFRLIVTLTNPTDRPLQISPCFPAMATWNNGWSSSDPPGTGGGSYAVSCVRAEPDTLAPGEVRTVVPPGEPGGFRFTAPTSAELGGEVPAGLIVAEIDFGPEAGTTPLMTYLLREGGG